MARIFLYRRENGRCPADEFIHKEIERSMQKKFLGQFDALSKLGPDYCNHQRFRPLTGNGKPLWEFKEHDHRFYCSRHIVQNRMSVVLFNGWAKDKEGKTDRENREIERAMTLYGELKREKCDELLGAF